MGRLFAGIAEAVIDCLGQPQAQSGWGPVGEDSEAKTIRARLLQPETAVQPGNRHS
jgi:hypothetical protein